MIVNLYNNKIRDIFTQFESLEDAISRTPSDMTLMDAPEYVSLGWTYQEGVWCKPEQAEVEYDIEDGRFYPHDEYRAILHERTTNDTMQAMRKIREGDTSYDWQGWLNKLDAYNKAVSDTKNQPTYPDKVEYPEYPSR